MNDTIHHLLHLRTSEQGKPQNPWRRQLLHSLEIAICLSEQAEKEDEKTYAASSTMPTAR